MSQGLLARIVGSIRCVVVVADQKGASSQAKRAKSQTGQKDQTGQDHNMV